MYRPQHTEPCVTSGKPTLSIYTMVPCPCHMIDVNSLITSVHPPIFSLQASVYGQAQRSQVFVTYVLSSAICFNHVFDFLPTYGTQRVFLPLYKNGTLVAHAHVSTSIQHRIDSSLIADRAFIVRIVGHGATLLCSLLNLGGALGRRLL